MTIATSFLPAGSVFRAERMHYLNRILTSATRARVIRGDHPAMPYVRHFPGSMLDYLLVKCFGDLHNLRFIQIGANDGTQADPIISLIERYAWSGILLEPVPAPFASLQKLYALNPRIRLINAALDTTKGSRVIYDFQPPVNDLPGWSRGLASFSREQVISAARSFGFGAETVKSLEIATLTWDDIWPRDNPGCDLLVLDTEGYDCALLSSINLSVMRPRMIQFEHACASLDETLSVYRTLRLAGYEIATEGTDTLAWLPPPI